MMLFGNTSCWRRLGRVLLAVAAASLYPSVLTDTSCVGRESGGEGSATFSTNGKSVCVTDGCVRAASILLENVDFSQDPCDNFYKFACGTFIKNTIIPDDKFEVTTYTETEELVRKQIKIILEEPVAPNEPRPFRLLKNFYKACMNTSHIEDIGLTEYLKMLKYFGGWPVLEGSAWDESIYDWKENNYKFREYGIPTDFVIMLSVEPDLKNTTLRILELGQQLQLGLNREFLVKGLDDELVQAYYKYMVAAAILLGADKTEAEKELKESLLFEIELAKLSIPPEELFNFTKLYNLVTIPELQQQFPSILWEEYITKLLVGTIQLKSDEVINIAVPSYISSVVALLNTTPKRVIANYMQWRVFHESVLYLTESARNVQLDYLKIRDGTSQQHPRWSECVDMTSLWLEVAVSSLYVQKFFKQDTKRSAIELADTIQEEIVKTLTVTEWMDEETRKHALEKAKALTEFMGYPDEILVTENLDEYYKKLEISPDKYLEAVMNVRRFKLDFSFSQLRELYNKSDWRHHAESVIVNALNDLSQNYIECPAGILQGAFFSSERPMYCNFGAIGYIIGHEYTHGYDISGHQFDKDGHLVDWWKPETKKLYSEKAACFTEQYGNYTVEEVGLKVNGITTQGENVADCGGIKEAYRAYNTWESKFGEEAQLPGFLNYTSQQMFWISAASVWCGKFRPETLIAQVNTDPHAPYEFRVIGPFSNREEFSKDFNCPVGSKMNPVKKCKLW